MSDQSLNLLVVLEVSIQKATNVNRAVLAAGAANRNGNVVTIIPDEMRQPIVNKRFNVLKHLFAISLF